jgi:hypothetical protein
MKLKKYILGDILISFLIFSCILNPIFADFQVGGSCLPIDEEGFIEYDYDKYTPPGPVKLKVDFIDLSKIYEPVEAIGVNISVMILNSSINKYEAITVNSTRYQNKALLVYNKTLQYFKYNQSMDNLLLNGYGGYYIIPNNPVDANIVKEFVERYSVWSAIVTNNTVTIYIANDQIILTYNEQGLLIKEEVMSNNMVISVLTFLSYTANQKEDIGDLNIILFLSIIILISITWVLINKNSIRKKEDL